jgi:hypothetical protein
VPRTSRRALTKALRRESLDERFWPENRLHQSEAVHLLDAQGIAVTAQDPRFGRFVVLLNRRFPLTGQRLEEVRTLAATADPTTLAMVDDLMSAITQANQLTAAQEVRELAMALMPSRQHPQPTVAKVDLIEPRYGVEGRMLTLSEIGERHSLTRERARQVQELFEARLSAGSIYAPRLEAVRRTLAGIDFALVEPLQQQLAPELGPMVLEGALDLMERVLEWPMGGRIAHARRNPSTPELAVWTQSLTETAVSSVMQQAAAMSSSVGAFLVTGIIGLVAEHAQRFVTREQIHQILSAWPSAHWVDEETGWGWVDGVEKGPMITDVCRILAVAQPLSVDIAAIYAGLTQPKRAALKAERPNRFSGLMAPRWVLQYILEQLPEFEVAQYDNFRLRTPVDPRSVMEDGTGLAIYDAIVKRGGLATWQQLKQDLVESQGVNPITFGVVLKNRCWIEQPGYGLYGLRGLRLHIEQVRAKGRVHTYLPPVVPAPGPLPLDYGAGFTMPLRQTSVSREANPHRVISIPHRFHAGIVPGEYRHGDGSGRMITVGSTQVSRFPNELSDAGVGPGESVLLTLDTENKTYAWERGGEGEDLSGPT